MKKVLAVLVVLSLASLAQAGVTVNIVPGTAGEYATLGDGTATGYDVYLVASDDASRVTAVGPITFSGAVYQVGAWGKLKTTPVTMTPTLADMEGIADPSIVPAGQDSHFMTVFESGSPTEANDKSLYGSVFAAYDYFEGKGNLDLTKGFYSIPDFSQNLLLAHIVILDSDVAAKNYAWLNGLVANGDGGITELVNIPIGVPEPATMALLAMGALALIRRRR